ncbi:MAG: apolipoprotein N-acyltransferase [Desulfobacterium sp.]|nr:apolipoprotein N-acyltransferase [Desulfobacterium sp.]
MTIIPQKLYEHRKEYLLAIVSGLLMTSAFPKINLDWVAWFAFIPLLYSIKNLSVKNAFYIGLVAGITHYITLLYWLVPTMHTYGNLPIWLGSLLILLLSSYLGLYYAVFTSFLTKFCKTPSSIAIWFPMVIVSLEFIRSLLFSGFPWELIGYSQFERLNLIQLSDITGVYGISFLIALVNGSLYLTLLYTGKQEWQGVKVTKKTAWGSLVITALIMIIVLAYGNVRIQLTDRKIETAEKIKVSVIQGNIDQSLKWNPEYQKITILKYLELSFSTLPDSPSLIVWPETATPFYFSSPYGSQYLKRLIQEGVKEANISLLFGSPSYKRDGEAVNYYNTAYLLNPDGKEIGSYNKVHLVPYGEYVPLKEWFPFIGKLVAQVGDFKTGTKGSTILWNQHRMGVQICFEVIFPDLARAMASNQADFFINITNDAWFGTSSGPFQHFSMTVFRAVENKRALVRSANTGISGFIDPTGRILDTTSLSVDSARTNTVPLMKIKTVYMKVGDLFAKICLITVLVFLAFYFIQHQKRNRKN